MEILMAFLVNKVEHQPPSHPQYFLVSFSYQIPVPTM